MSKTHLAQIVGDFESVDKDTNEIRGFAAAINDIKATIDTLEPEDIVYMVSDNEDIIIQDDMNMSESESDQNHCEYDEIE